MYQRKQRRFRRHSNSRNHGSRDNVNPRIRQRPNQFSNGPTRNNIRPSLSVEKLFDKYSSLAKEAMASGDKTLYENFLQHADHFMRILNEKGNQKKSTYNNKNSIEENNPSQYFRKRAGPPGPVGPSPRAKMF